MAEFAHNNTRNGNTNHISFDLNCGYLPSVSFKAKVDACSKFYSGGKLAKELKELIIICQQNLLYAQELQKRAHNKSVKSYRYVSGEKI